MTGISTLQSYQSVLLGIQLNQQRQTTAQQQVSSGKLATDLKGYAAHADTLTALQATSARLGAYADAGARLSDRLDAQAQALTGVSDAVTGARQAVFSALATGDATTLLQTLKGWSEQATDALNVDFQGRYLFAGGQPDTPPVTAAADDPPGAVETLTPPAFSNGTQVETDRLDDRVTVSPGQLADGIGTQFYAALKAVADVFQPPAAAPGKLTGAQQASLKAALSGFDAAGTTVSAAVASNAVVQNRVDTTLARVNAQKSGADGVLTNITDADPAKAISDLQLATAALDASAQVFGTLKASSLLAVLQAG